MNNDENRRIEDKEKNIITLIEVKLRKRHMYQKRMMRGYASIKLIPCRANTSK